MAQVKLPFKSRFDHALASGEKSATSRTKRYGRKGDTFPREVFFPDGCPACDLRTTHTHDFEFICDPVRINLGIVLDALFDIEGCADSDEAWGVWRDIHPRREWAGFENVWLHRFKILED